MALIFNIDESVTLSEFNILREPIQMKMENEMDAFEKSDILPSIFAMETTSKYQEEFRSSTAMGGFKPTRDLEVSSLADFQESYGKNFKTQIWKSSFVISQQSIEDSDDLNTNKKVSEFIKSYGRTKNNYGFTMLAGALTGSAVFEGVTFDCTGADTTDGSLDGTKQTYFHNAHKPVTNADYSETQSNKFYASIDLSKAGAEEGLLEAIGVVETAMQNFTDDKGNILDVKPDTIIIGNDYKLKKVMLTALKTQYTSAMGDNGVNIQYGNWNILTSPYLGQHAGFKSTDKAFILLDSKRNKDVFGAVWFDRKPLTISSYVDKDTNANKWNGRSRYQAGFFDYRCMAYCTCAGSVANATNTGVTVA